MRNENKLKNQILKIQLISFFQIHVLHHLKPKYTFETNVGSFNLLNSLKVKKMYCCYG